MNYPPLDDEVKLQRIRRSITQMKVGDIVECWLDCTPDPGCTLPLPVVIVAQPDLNSQAFLVKDIFGADSYPLIFAYQWRIVGHINGFAELQDSERNQAVLATAHFLQGSSAGWVQEKVR